MPVEAKGPGCSGTGVTGGCEPSGLGAGSPAGIAQDANCGAISLAPKLTILKSKLV